MKKHGLSLILFNFLMVVPKLEMRVNCVKMCFYLLKITLEGQKYGTAAE